MILSVNEKIEVLEFSNCGLNNKSSSSIKRIINNHAKRRDENFWLNDHLGKTSKIISKGIVKLVLSKNLFSDQFVTELLPILRYDQYLITLDLSDNSIKSNGIFNLIDWVESARNVLNLNLKGNPGYTDVIHKRLIKGLRRNIKRVKVDKNKLKKMIKKKLITKELLAQCDNNDIEEYKTQTLQKKMHKKKIKKKELKNGNLKKVETEEIKPAPAKTTPICEKLAKTKADIVIPEDYKSISCTYDKQPRPGYIFNK